MELSPAKRVVLPCPAEKLVPHRPPMLLVETLLERQAHTALAEAYVPGEGIWVDSEKGILAEYHIELIAQTMAAANGYDALHAGDHLLTGLLVGVSAYRLAEQVVPGEKVWIAIEKTFEFGAVKIIRGLIRNADRKKATAELKVWEGDLAGTGQ